MEIVYRNLSDIKPNPKNPRKATPESIKKLAESISQNKKFFEARPILLSDRTGELVIIGGERRSEAAALLQMETVPTILLSGLTEAQEDEILIQDNTHAGVWDEQKLQAWGKEQLQGWNVDGVKWAKEHTQVKEDDFDPDKKEKSRVKFGDIWQLGRHRLMCGDSTKRADVERLTGGGQMDLCFQSPPYNIGTNAKLNDRDDENKYVTYNDENPEYLQLIETSTKLAMDISKFVAINIQMLSKNKIQFIRWLYELRNSLCDIAIWYKDNVAPAMAHRVMNSAFEFIVFFCKKNPSRAIGTKQWRGTLSNVFQSHIQMHNEFSKEHSATFPIQFVSHFVFNLTNENDFILDLFGGTGTTLIAAEQLNRTCYMMELDPHYCDIIIDRWENFTGQKAYKIE